MSDIFLSYASADLHRVRPLIEALERRGWSVWRDRTILPGQTYDQLIEEALEAARCVIVVWSQASIVSAWVRAEADEGRQRGILVPVFIDDGIRIPLAFRPIQAARLVDWHGREPHQEFAKVVRAVTNLLGSPVPEEPAVPEEAEGPPEPRHASRQSSIDMGFIPKRPEDKAGRVARIKKRSLLWAVGLLALVLILYEEAGYTVAAHELRRLGQVRPSKSADTVVHLFAVDVTQKQPQVAPGDGSRLETNASVVWVGYDQGMHITDPLFVTAMARLQARLSPDH